MEDTMQLRIQDSVVRFLLDHKMTITTVESCTGGMISARLTDVAGVSEVFKQAFITYSDEAKHKMVGVKKDTLDTYTAVSEQTAWEMAYGGAKEAKADVCISVTGYAGPPYDENDDSVGLVYIGCNIKGNIVVEEHHFEGDRSAVRNQAAERALTLAFACMQSECKK